jgi:hypothetical protein
LRSRDDHVCSRQAREHSLRLSLLHLAQIFWVTI